MKVNYTVKFTIDLEPGDYLSGVGPKELVREMFEEDPKQLFADSEAQSIVVGKIVQDETESAYDEDDDHLTILDEEELALED